MCDGMNNINTKYEKYKYKNDWHQNQNKEARALEIIIQRRTCQRNFKRPWQSGEDFWPQVWLYRISTKFESFWEWRGQKTDTELKELYTILKIKDR